MKKCLCEHSFSIKHTISTLHNPSLAPFSPCFRVTNLIPYPVDHPVAGGTQCSRFHWCRSGTADVSAFPRNS